MNRTLYLIAYDITKDKRLNRTRELLKGLRKINERKWLAVNGVVTAIFRTVIIERLITTGLDPHLGVIHRRHNHGLALDICYIMGGESDIQTLQFFRSRGLKELIRNDDANWTVSDDGIKNIVHRFENRRRDLREKIDKTIDDLFDLIREMLS